MDKLETVKQELIRAFKNYWETMTPGERLKFGANVGVCPCAVCKHMRELMQT